MKGDGSGGRRPVVGQRDARIRQPWSPRRSPSGASVPSGGSIRAPEGGLAYNARPSTRSARRGRSRLRRRCTRAGTMRVAFNRHRRRSSGRRRVDQAVVVAESETTGDEVVVVAMPGRHRSTPSTVGYPDPSDNRPRRTTAHVRRALPHRSRPSAEPPPTAPRRAVRRARRCRPEPSHRPTTAWPSPAASTSSVSRPPFAGWGLVRVHRAPGRRLRRPRCLCLARRRQAGGQGDGPTARRLRVVGRRRDHRQAGPSRATASEDARPVAVMIDPATRRRGRSPATCGGPSSTRPAAARSPGTARWPVPMPMGHGCRRAAVSSSDAGATTVRATRRGRRRPGSSADEAARRFRRSLGREPASGSRSGSPTTADPQVGRLSLLSRRSGERRARARRRRADPGCPALPGFSIGDGRLAWATPPGQGGEGSRVQIVAWTDDGVGVRRERPGDGRRRHPLTRGPSPDGRGCAHRASGSRIVPAYRATQRLVVGSVLTAALALVALPGLAGSRAPSAVEPVPAGAFQPFSVPASDVAIADRDRGARRRASCRRASSPPGTTFIEPGDAPRGRPDAPDHGRPAGCRARHRAASRRSTR